MGFKERYGKAKEKLLADEAICEANRDVFREFFDFEEYKLKRQNQLAELDEASYNTLYGYIIGFKNVNAWFKNKPWKDLTKDDIKDVYDDLEDGNIRNRRGLRFRNRRSYYNKIFKSKPFRIVRKAELAREVIEFSAQERHDVSFVTEEMFQTMVSVLSKPHHLLLFWLAWDIGENVGALLQLTKRDFVRQDNAQTREPEYLINLPKNKLKRSRQERSEPTLYSETVRYADMVLAGLGPDDRVFKFGHRQALKLIHNVVEKTGATRIPDGGPPRWKHLRSGMACHLLRSGCTREEVDARLGHRPGSSALDRYLNFLAIDRDKAKQKVQQSSLETKQIELVETRQRERLAKEGMQRQHEANERMAKELDRTKSDIQELRAVVRRILASMSDLAAQVRGDSAIQLKA